MFYFCYVDGWVVLCLMLWEYIGFEVLYYFGILLLCLLCMFISNECVYWELFELGVMMIRMVFSYLCFGYFEYYFYSKEFDILDKFMDFILICYFLDCVLQVEFYKVLLKVIILCIVRMVVLWQVYGFVYGVMNIDNMLIYGIIFDYGLYVFME